jgi:hypothetical protein
MSREHPFPDRSGVERYLDALYKYAPTAAWIEVRFRSGSRMRQSFHPARELDVVADTILARSAASDVFVGVVPRARRSGGRADLIAYWNVVWADCDKPKSLAALEDFRPAAQMIVASSEGRRHAYWFLSDTVGPNCVESINRRLAVALGADMRSTDGARILRPGGSLNRKYTPPTQVRLLRCREQERVTAAELESNLPRRFSTPPRVSGRARQGRVLADPLRRIPPRVYVERLTGRRVDRWGKIHCPFHEDRRPSLHVYSDPERGWTCFGCSTPAGRPLGGDVYTLASMLWRIPPYGRDFLTLRARLDRVFGVHRV